ncbi:hypothetical protein NC796_15565 [Aliifodinibius sp. S!AR15-10]|uniref:hypothetical protein n=1 Tax=Aliifodinibius sp. S!AR15-10 TaxID=2950437 RepID=UPI00285E51A7|nr:hypothetical protein [Aliifodinibius sp. S!AR15-10]MDR8392573.1 hypothetical protein [Aliifodinibius sp. S!AR15-10]
MNSYKFEFHLTKTCPIDLSGRKIRYNGNTYNIELPANKREITIYPVEGDSHETAEILARDIVNLFLTKIFSRIQYGPIVQPVYGWSDLDNPTSKAQVVKVPKPSWFTGDTRIGKKLSLSDDLIGAAHMRAGDLATGPFDSFRNYYLAVDSIGKRVRGKGNDSTVISDTLQLVVCKTKIKSLSKLLKEVEIPQGVKLKQDEIKNIETVLYKAFRCALMHSGKKSDLTPFNSKDERQVNSALRLMRGTAWQYVRYERTKLI